MIEERDLRIRPVLYACALHNKDMQGRSSPKIYSVGASFPPTED
jgi:hypothetical protein